uniref:RRM domain-containing protein n=1 Tax=Oryza punctata TaxID=4537 RepID=A0A0E0M0K6_ORYPU
MASAGRRQGENREAKRKRRRRKKNKSKQAAAGGEANTSIYENQQRQGHQKSRSIPKWRHCHYHNLLEGSRSRILLHLLHSELNCPYNYLSPASYVPCRARLTIWNDEVFKPYQTFGRFSKPTKQDRIFARRRESLRRVVRVTNLPASRSASAARRLITGLFAQFGPLRMYHVAMLGGGGGGEEEDDGDGDDDVCVGGGGIGCVVFERREDAEKAIDELNCYVIDGHSLRVDWVYPYCGK